MKKCLNWVPLDNIGQYKTILFNALQYQDIFDNIRLHPNVSFKS